LQASATPRTLEKCGDNFNGGVLGTTARDVRHLSTVTLFSSVHDCKATLSSRINVPHNSVITILRANRRIPNESKRR
jgi:hypothetical protein